MHSLGGPLVCIPSFRPLGFMVLELWRRHTDWLTDCDTHWHLLVSIIHTLTKFDLNSGGSCSCWAWVCDWSSRIRRMHQPLSQCASLPLWWLRQCGPWRWGALNAIIHSRGTAAQLHDHRVLICSVPLRHGNLLLAEPLQGLVFLSSRKSLHVHSSLFMSVDCLVCSILLSCLVHPFPPYCLAI